MAKDKHKKDKKKSKESAGQRSHAADSSSDPVGPLVMLERIDFEDLGIGVKRNPLSKALNAIKRAARESTLHEEVPIVLVAIGAEIKEACPAGYEHYWDPPLSAKQLERFLADVASVRYVKEKNPGQVGVLGHATQEALDHIVDALLTQASRPQAP